MEDSVEGEKKDLQEKIESLESIVRMLELKSKNAADHGENKIHMWLLCNCQTDAWVSLRSIPIR